MKTKTYVVTGSTSGIGKALLERIAADKVRKDAKEVSNSTSARKKMIANMTGGRK